VSAPPQGSIQPTKVGALLAVFIIGAVCGYVVVPVTEAFDDPAPTVEWTSVFGLALAALTVLVLALSTYRTVHREQRRMPPQRALNFLIFAKACAFAGSFIVGGYLGFASHFVDNLEAALPRERVYRSIVAAVAAAVVVIGGLLLERACRIPRDDDEQP
jgi:amino acid permease